MSIAAPIRVTPLLTIGALALVSGCQFFPADHPNSGAGGEDANRNGFVDIQPPDGVTFDTPSNVKILVRNELSADDLAPLAAAYGVDPNLVDLASVRVKIRWTIAYPDGQTQSIDSVEPLAPFDQRIEIACPRDADLSVDIEAGLPIPGAAPIAVVPLDFDIDSVSYDCGDTIEYRAFINDAGQPEQSVDVY